MVDAALGDIAANWSGVRADRSDADELRSRLRGRLTQCILTDMALLNPADRLELMRRAGAWRRPEPIVGRSWSMGMALAAFAPCRPLWLDVSRQWMRAALTANRLMRERSRVRPPQPVYDEIFHKGTAWLNTQ